MSSSGKDFDLASVTSDTSLLSNKDTKDQSQTKRSLLSRLSGLRRDAFTGSAAKTSAPSDASANPASSSSSGKTQSGSAVEDLYRAYPAMGTNARLT